MEEDEIFWAPVVWVDQLDVRTNSFELAPRCRGLRTDEDEEDVRGAQLRVFAFYITNHEPL